MSRILIILAVALMTTTSAMAVTADTSGATGVAPTALIAKAEAVCATDAVVSPALASACQTKTWPAAIKDGTRFRATGVGGEFNTLIRQLPAATAAK